MRVPWMIRDGLLLNMAILFNSGLVTVFSWLAVAKVLIDVPSDVVVYIPGGP